ncbi:cation/calcium exchanger 5 [Iris pallida]|uniref:Cation/calcium exchanger 5 n=1 Tax=Iris pallida TaxID=29817 RepID=A0AAX6DFR4_IRIPA|nr:cation/calcium exchanger 5 [Iris pallida]
MPWPLSLKPITISLFLFSTILFFLLFPPNPNPNPNYSSRSLLEEEGEEKPTSCSSILSLPPSRRCAFSLSHCPSSSVLNYASLHFCRLREAPSLSLPLLSLLLLLHFRLLSLSASSHFSPVVSRLSSLLRLSPSMAAVTLLALGNGAPDAFASLAALRSSPRSSNLPFAALLSAGAFVSAFVVGLVALHAGPFPLSPAPFLRDVSFYLLAALTLFYVYLSAGIYLWQAVGLVAFYAFFVGLVFWMDLGAGGEGGAGEARKRGDEVEMEAAGLLEEGRSAIKDPEMEVAAANASSSLTMLGKVAQLWEVPIATLLKLTIPAASPSEWNRFYAAANIALCPLALLYSFNSFIPMDSQIVFFLPHSHFPIWSIVLFVSLCLAVAHFFLEKEPPLTEAEQIATTLFAFVMSVFWISTTAGELLNCLTAVGIIMDLPPAILGLTVLAWGNSVGDLVADVSLAKAGQPATAMAGCFAGPMFNMLVGLGTALVIETAKVYPGAYELQFNISIVVAFVFLLLSLMGTLLVVTWSRFRVPRFWGFCLVGLYVLFTAVSLAIARFSG